MSWAVPGSASKPGRTDHQASHHGCCRRRSKSFASPQRNITLPLVAPQATYELSRASPHHHGCDVEHVTRLDMRSPIDQFLGDDFQGRFDRHFAPPHLHLARRDFGETTGANEVDFANIVKGQFQRTCSVRFVRGRHRLKEITLCLGIEVRQSLRIIEKQIDVMALAMTNVEHQCRAAAKRPIP